VPPLTKKGVKETRNFIKLYDDDNSFSIYTHAYPYTHTSDIIKNNKRS
jgi:hypothetical protein